MQTIPNQLGIFLGQRILFFDDKFYLPIAFN